MIEEIEALGTVWHLTSYINPFSRYGPDGYVYEDKDNEFMPVEVPPLTEEEIAQWIEENAVRKR